MQCSAFGCACAQQHDDGEGDRLCVIVINNADWLVFILNLINSYISHFNETLAAVGGTRPHITNNYNPLYSGPSKQKDEVNGPSDQCRSSRTSHVTWCNV